MRHAHLCCFCAPAGVRGFSETQDRRNEARHRPSLRPLAASGGRRRAARCAGVPAPPDLHLCAPRPTASISPHYKGAGSGPGARPQPRAGGAGKRCFARARAPTHGRTVASRRSASPRHDPSPEVPPRKSGAELARRGSALGSGPAFARARPAAARRPRLFRCSRTAEEFGRGVWPGAMAPGAARRARRRVRGAQPAGARARSAEDWWWDRLAPSGSGYHLLQSDSMLLVLPGPGPARTRVQRRAARRTQRLLSPASRVMQAAVWQEPPPAPRPPDRDPACTFYTRAPGSDTHRADCRSRAGEGKDA